MKVSQKIYKAPKKISFNNQNKKKLIGTMGLLLVLVMAASLCIGAYFIDPREVFQILRHKLWRVPVPNGMAGTIVWDIRLTRILLAVTVGAALASSGAVYQGIFRNPLIEPYILGVSSGAAFGAALAILFEFPYSLQLLAFFFGMLAVTATYSVARMNGETPLVTLILSGVIISSLFSAMVSIFQYIGTEEQLRRLVFWLMGGLYQATWSDIKTILPVVAVGVLLLWMNAWKLNVLSLGETEAKTLGIHTERTKAVLMVTATAITAISVSLTGIIGWVGLMLPHAARLIVGPDHRFLIPLAAIMGSIFLVICDTLARTISTGEVPIGIITAILGAPYLLFLLRRRSNYMGG
ncbi:FecCD family ABC transporter permease [Anoxynatronum buryatiense]|uniref:Iron complex transport system permease protein n=1 Tax=Anoxynatronum buryatiense TaxID=489973 RepID=A0AA45WZ96_9CLOT|nr:iron chelate uptake ABC transporter family permease subunit [Anoxynatronum buryatiense]SMP71118.1 iron complex transport system permease protein [Anoxynatronum buryatiense]